MKNYIRWILVLPSALVSLALVILIYTFFFSSILDSTAIDRVGLLDQPVSYGPSVIVFIVMFIGLFAFCIVGATVAPAYSEIVKKCLAIIGGTSIAIFIAITEFELVDSWTVRMANPLAITIGTFLGCISGYCSPRDKLLADYFRDFTKSK